MAGTKSSGNQSKRTLNWCIVVYPDSAPSDWRDYLDSLHIEWVESPLHEFDINPGTGEIKKPHWHVLLLFGSVKTYEQVCEVIAPLNCPIPQRCFSVKGNIRYMVHMDNPDKYQYKISDIVAHGGYDIANAFKPSASERYTIIRDMCAYVRANDICEFQDLVDYAMEEHFDDWFPLLCDSCAYVVGQYIKSQRHRSSVIDN